MEKINPKQRFEMAIRGGRTDRVPVLPKIWIDLACNLRGVNPLQAVRNPDLVVDTILQAALGVRADAARLFIFPKREVEQEGEIVYQIDSSGRRIGSLDMKGGWMTSLDDPEWFDLMSEDWIASNHFYPAGAVPHINSVGDAERIAVPTADYYEHAGYGQIVNEALAKAGDSIYCIGDCDTPTLSFFVTMRGMEQALLDLLVQPEIAHACFQKGVEICFERAKFWLNHGIKVLRLNDSTANMSVISADQWKEFIAPYFKQFCEKVRNYREEAAIYCHICGNVLPIIEELADTGLACIGPMDPLGGFTIAQARERIGDRVALMGGVNTLTLLNATPEEIRQQSRECIRMNGNRGGFVLGSGCVVPPATPAANVKAMVEAAESM